MRKRRLREWSEFPVVIWLIQSGGNEIGLRNFGVVPSITVLGSMDSGKALLSFE